MNSNGSPEFQPPSRPFIVEKELSHSIVGSFLEVYNELGFGLVEPLYSRALEIVLRARGFQVDREYPLIVKFRGQQIGFQRLDMLVERRVIVELKSTERLAASDKRQLRSYVKAMGLDLGILLHFGPVLTFYRELGGRCQRRQKADSS
jgi:GxxExxY protein